MGSLRQLLTGFRYLAIRGSEKRVVDIWAPMLLTAPTVAVLFSLNASLLHDPGLVPMLNGMLQVLFAFFVAALAAVATFPSRAMGQPAIGLTLGGRTLARRQFLCYLFGYLSVLSLFLYLAGVAAILAHAWLAKFGAVAWLRWGAAAVYCFVFWNMVTVTLLGLHYLVDRVHRPDPTINAAPATATAKAPPSADSDDD